MCGIAGFTGKKEASPILLSLLEGLEYRGYDSAGLSVLYGGKIKTVRAKGKVSSLKEKIKSDTPMGRTGIAHTRWATHGEPAERNAHPHTSADGRISLVHNGIIENHAELKSELLDKGYTFFSETDTEVALNLIHSLYCGDPIRAISEATKKIRGSYAFALLFADFEGSIFTARYESPLAVCKVNEGAYAVSDATALFGIADKVVYLENGQIAEITAEGEIALYDSDLSPVEPIYTDVQFAGEITKGGYPHYMLKEIYEQPLAVASAIDGFSVDDSILEGAERVIFTACGSAYHVCTVAKNIVERLSDIRVECDIASELRYKRPRLGKGDLFIVISQSGETADTLAALRYAKEKGAVTLGIVNAVGSAIAREAEHVIYTCAGPEIAVATTKAYSAQLASVYMLLARFALVRGEMDGEDYEKYLLSVRALPSKIEKMLECADDMHRLAEKYARVSDAYFIGRGNDFAAALECSLKLKEISYIHSEAYAAGELKHGTISLIENGIPVFALATVSDLFEKMASNAAEVVSRGASLIALVAEDCTALDAIAEAVIRIPRVNELFSASLLVLPMQFFSYFISLARGNDPDKPRSLAKSVTVE